MNIPVPHDEHNDNQLLQMLDEPGAWFIRGGPTGVMGGPTGSLRAALARSRDLSMHGHSPGPIVRMPDDGVIVLPNQTFRLWQILYPV
jgi:hypothetical protein